MESLLVYPPVLLALFAGLFTWFVTALGASLVFFFKDINIKVLNAMLGFAAGVMIAASFWSLLAPAIEMAEGGKMPAYVIVSLGFLGGGFFLWLVDKILPHVHQGTNHREGIKTSWQRSVLLVLAITFHNIPEGLAVGIAIASVKTNLVPALILSIGIGIQNFPEGTAISLPLHESGISRFKAMMYGQYSALVEIPSALLGFLFAQLFSSILPFALSFAAGAMMFVCIEELIPEANALKEVDVGTMSFMVGFMIMMMLDVMFG